MIEGELYRPGQHPGKLTFTAGGSGVETRRWAVGAATGSSRPIAVSGAPKFRSPDVARFYGGKAGFGLSGVRTNTCPVF